MQDETVERLELKIAYLERASQELSDALYRQSQALDALAARFDALLQRLEAEDAAPTAWTPEQEKPPHY